MKQLGKMATNSAAMLLLASGSPTSAKDSKQILLHCQNEEQRPLCDALVHALGQALPQLSVTEVEDSAISATMTLRYIEYSRTSDHLAGHRHAALVVNDALDAPAGAQLELLRRAGRGRSIERDESDERIDQLRNLGYLGNDDEE